MIGSADIPPGKAAAALFIHTALVTITVVVPVGAYLLLGARCAACWNRPRHGWFVYYGTVIAVALAIIAAVFPTAAAIARDPRSTLSPRRVP